MKTMHSIEFVYGPKVLGRFSDFADMFKDSFRKSGVYGNVEIRSNRVLYARLSSTNEKALAEAHSQVIATFGRTLKK